MGETFAENQNSRHDLAGKTEQERQKGNTKRLVFPFFKSNVYPADKLHTIETEILCLGKESPDEKLP